jgi:hypothetical protein
MRTAKRGEPLCHEEISGFVEWFKRELSGHA